eukprot:scaffold5816_cov267-Pinguiococcus_pyrenoidosus.AAC.19
MACSGPRHGAPSDSLASPALMVVPWLRPQAGAHVNLRLPAPRLEQQKLDWPPRLGPPATLVTLVRLSLEWLGAVWHVLGGSKWPRCIPTAHQAERVALRSLSQRHAPSRPLPPMPSRLCGQAPGPRKPLRGVLDSLLLAEAASLIRRPQDSSGADPQQHGATPALGIHTTLARVPLDGNEARPRVVRVAQKRSRPMVQGAAILGALELKLPDPRLPGRDHLPADAAGVHALRDRRHILVKAPACKPAAPAHDSVSSSHGTAVLRGVDAKQSLVQELGGGVFPLAQDAHPRAMVVVLRGHLQRPSLAALLARGSTQQTLQATQAARERRFQEMLRRVSLESSLTSCGLPPGMQASNERLLTSELHCFLKRETTLVSGAATPEKIPEAR